MRSLCVSELVMMDDFSKTEKHIYAAAEASHTMYREPLRRCEERRFSDAREPGMIHVRSEKSWRIGHVLGSIRLGAAENAINSGSINANRIPAHFAWQTGYSV